MKDLFYAVGSVSTGWTVFLGVPKIQTQGRSDRFFHVSRTSLNVSVWFVCLLQRRDAATFGVEAEQTGVGVVGGGEGLAHLIHNAGIGRRIGATGSAQGCLINHHCFLVLTEKGFSD